MDVITSTIMIVAATMTAMLLTPGSNALAQDNASCDAACPVPCYFGTCAPADATYKRALAKCDMRSLESVAQLYAGTTSASKAHDALGILRSRGYGTSRIGVTPNTSGGGNTQNCTAIVDGGETSGPCALVNAPVGFRCEVVGGRADLIPSGGSPPVSSQSSQGCAGLIAPAGTRCELGPLGNAYFVQPSPPGLPTPTVTAPAPAASTTAVSDNPIVGGAPMFASRNIIENAVNSADHMTLVAAVKAAGLVDTLSGPGPFTVFAPTNAAFAALPAGTVGSLLLPEYKAKLTQILTYHVVAANAMSSDIASMIAGDGGAHIVRTVAGNILFFRSSPTGGIQISDENGRVANVTIADVKQSNGVIHVIDAVLLPGS